MKKKIIALLLAVLFVLSLSSCSKMVRSDSGSTPSGREDNVKDEGKYNFLIMGHDRAASLTDVMMLVSFDTKEHKATVLQLPRDTYVDLENYNYHKLNGAYNYFVGDARDEGSASADLDGCVYAAKFLSDNFDIRIHYCAVMDLDGFGDIVDAIGGVYMYVPYAMHYNDPGQNLYINLNVGFQTLDGNAAEQFVRFRSAYLMGDIAREDAQKMFMTAFLEAVKNNVSLSNVEDVASSIFKAVDTDMTTAEILTFAKELLSVNLEDVTMITLPGAGVFVNGGSYYVMNKEAVLNVLNKYYNIYEKPISAESFDKNGLFSGAGDSDGENIYYAAAEQYMTTEYNAKDVSDKDIDIPMY